jgi:hypothetical protein
MLRDGKARVVRRCPFTIQLMCEGTSYTQPVHLGIDAGSKRIGVSAATEKEVLYEAEVELRNDIKELLSLQDVPRGTPQGDGKAPGGHKTGEQV